jgi:hypothetical protein
LKVGRTEKRERPALVDGVVRRVRVPGRRRKQ